jgi:hypothetical protein
VVHVVTWCVSRVLYGYILIRGLNLILSGAPWCTPASVGYPAPAGDRYILCIQSPIRIYFNPWIKFNPQSVTVHGARGVSR